MNITLNRSDDDTGTLAITFGSDDAFSLSGYGERNGVNLELPLYSREAREMIAALQPLADATDAR